jgi:hypothetical protein
VNWRTRVGSRRALLAAYHRGRVWRGRAKRAGWGWECGAEGQSEPFQGSHLEVVGSPPAPLARASGLPATLPAPRASRAPSLPVLRLAHHRGKVSEPFQGSHVGVFHSA